MDERELNRLINRISAKRALCGRLNRKVACFPTTENILETETEWAALDRLIDRLHAATGTKL